MQIWSAEIKELESLYTSIKGRFPELEKELERLVKADDENMVLQEHFWGWELYFWYIHSSGKEISSSRDWGYYSECTYRIKTCIIYTEGFINS